MFKSATLRLLAALVAFSLIAAACGDDDDTGDVAAQADDVIDDTQDEEDPAVEPTTDQVDETPTAGTVPTPGVEADVTDLSVKPPITVPDGPPPAVLVTNDIVTGAGPVAASGDFAIMQYVGVSYSTGVEYDASWDRGQPFTFTLGQGQVIQGWDDGIVGMSPNGRRELTIPPDKAYGEDGSGSGAIGPDETLIFMVDLIGVVPADLEKPVVEPPDAPATELVTTDLVEGEGAEIATGSTVSVHYVGISQSTGEQFDASWDRGIEQVITFPVGAGQVIPGWDEGLLGMRVGGRREIVIPPDLAYGENGAGEGVIAPNETLVFVVDLIAISG
ncbi:MAG: FKBP-type peptidyl-prolyl cis-trans isomerase [Acidimicrobiales bacterium]